MAPFNVQRALDECGPWFFKEYYTLLKACAEHPADEGLKKRIHVGMQDWETDKGIAYTTRGTNIRIDNAVQIFLHHVVEEALIIAKATSYHPSRRKTAILQEVVQQMNQDPRSQWPKDYRTDDGHYVRSMSELVIDNWLYHHQHRHEYERSVFMPTANKAILSDFYLPDYNVYIEFWGLESDAKYTAYKERKVMLYQENALQLISLSKDDIKQLNDILPDKIQRYKGIGL